MHVRFRIVQICLASLALLEACSAQAPPSKDGVARLLGTLRQAQEASQAKKWAEAVSLWEEVTKQNPVTGDFWLQLARARHNKQDYAGAITAYDKAMSLGVNGLRSDIPYEVARCYARLGKRDLALDWFEKAMQLGYRDLQNAQQDPDLQPLHGDPKFRELTAADLRFSDLLGAQVMRFADHNVLEVLQALTL